MQQVLRLAALTVLATTLSACLGKKEKMEETKEVSISTATALNMAELLPGEELKMEASEAEIQALSKKLLANLEKSPGAFKKSPEGIYIQEFKAETGGIKPAENHRVTFHYRTYLPNGKAIQDSDKDGKPIETKFDYLIYGWKQVIKNYSAGSVLRIVVPPEHAYASAGSKDIPPDTTLVFDLSLIKVQKPQPKK